jgi:hypothetical protein
MKAVNRKSGRSQGAARKGARIKPALVFEQLEERAMFSGSHLVPPVLSATAVSGSQINLAWNLVAGANSYVVDELVHGSWKQIASLGSGGGSYKVGGLQSGATYDFEVGAHNGSGNAWSNTVVVTTLSKPATPSFSAAGVSSTEIDLSWSSASGATGYLISELKGKSWVQISKLGGGSTSYAVTGLSANTFYSFDVAAYNSIGTSTSSPQSALTFPIAPTLTATPVSTSEIDLSWTTSSGATGYVVEQWNGSSWVQIANLDGGSTAYAVAGLEADTTYYFEVGAYNAFGTSMSDYQSAMTLNGGPPAPILIATPVSSSEIDLSWNSISEATGYFVYEWDGTSWVAIADVDSSTTSYAVTGLTAGTTYYFELASYDSEGTTWANWQDVTTLGGNSSGFDDPTADVAYASVTGSLFGSNGPSYLDVQQGAVGDCWLLASLAEVAARDPSDIQSMFSYQGTGTDNGDTVGVYDVRLYDTSGAAHEITVDTELPGGGDYYDQVNNGVLWVALAEKAYSEANGKGWVETQYTGQDSYDALNGGYPSWALKAITGKSANDFAIKPADAAAAWKSGELVVLCTTSSPTNQYIVGDHAYAMVGFSASSSTPFTMYNPWGTDANGDGWYPGLYEGHQVYGQFNASAATISANFDLESFGNGMQAGAENLGGLLPSTGTATGDKAPAEIAAIPQTGRIQKPTPMANGVQPQFAIDNVLTDWGRNERPADSESPNFAGGLGFPNEALLDHYFGNLDGTLID